jgi:nucleotide-binding universal stress UspA family protein
VDIKPKNIQVCVSPGEDYEASLGFAIAEARRRGCGIHLTLVLRPIWVGPSEVTDLKMIDGEWRKYGTDFLMECEHRVQRLTDGAVPVSTEIIHGPVVPSLSDASANAALVVMQHHRMNRPLHIPSLSVTNGVAARAHAPLVAVPDTWRETDDHPGVVAVGVEDPVSSRVAAETAFKEAQRLGAAVHLVCAWFFSAAFDADVFRGEEGRIQTARVKEEIRSGFAPIVARFADVECKIVVIHGQPSDALVGYSEQVRLLVVGRHDPVLPLGSHLGPITRAVLNHAACPVLVVDPRG